MQPLHRNIIATLSSGFALAQLCSRHPQRNTTATTTLRSPLAATLSCESCLSCWSCNVHADRVLSPLQARNSSLLHQPPAPVAPCRSAQHHRYSILRLCSSTALPLQTNHPPALHPLQPSISSPADQRNIIATLPSGFALAQLCSRHPSAQHHRYPTPPVTVSRHPVL